MGYTTKQADPGVLMVQFEGPLDPDWEQWVMFSSDRHFDSVHCDRKLMKAHLDLAKERKALIVDVGDFFDAMQGKFDPRRSYAVLRPEYKVSNYLDEIMEDAADFLGPYAENFLVIGRGNHDQSILKNVGTDLISNLVHRLNVEHGGHIVAGGYGGWVRLLFQIGKSGLRRSMNIKYFHGSGGGGPVTRGTIQTNRQAVYLPDADVVVNGHTHDAYIVPIAREKLSTQGRMSQDLVWFLRTPPYQQDYQFGQGGFHDERGGPPKPKGCAWMRLSRDGTEIRSEMYLDLG